MQKIDVRKRLRYNYRKYEESKPLSEKMVIGNKYLGSTEITNTDKAKIEDIYIYII